MALNIRKFIEGIGLVGKAVSTIDTLGELEALTSDNKVYMHNGTTASPLVTETHAATLTNKTIDADNNTITDIRNINIATSAAIDFAKLASLTASRAVITDGSGVITISATTAAEIAFVSGVTSAIQTQLNGKVNDTGDTMTGALAFSGSGLWVGTSSNHNFTIRANNTNYITVENDGTVILGASGGSVNHAFQTNEIHLTHSSSSGNFEFLRNVNTGSLSLSGGTGSGNSGAIKFYGNGYTPDPTKQNFVEILNNGNAGANWDASGHQNVLNRRQIRFNDLDGDYIGLRAPAGVASSMVFDLPGADGVGGQPLVTDGAAALGFASAITLPEIATPSTPASGFGKLYFKTDNKPYILTDGGVESELLTSDTSNDEPKQNFLLNSNFDFWQRMDGSGFLNTGNGSTGYLADRWYVRNTLGTNGFLRTSRTTGVSDGAQYGLSVVIVTAPTASQNNGTELYQTLDNFTSRMLYNQTASFQIKVKAAGNVNQVGIQFFYATTQTKVTTAIGSEVTATVNSGTFTPITISGQALGTSMTTSGVVGVRIRITGVSSGNTYDLNNGFIVEQAMLNLGSSIAPYQRQFKTFTDELTACERFYEKSYNFDALQGAFTASGAVIFRATSSDQIMSIRFRAKKPQGLPITMVYYNSVVNNNGTWRDNSANANRTVTSVQTGDDSFSLALTGAVTGNTMQGQWSAEAEI